MSCRAIGIHTVFSAANAAYNIAAAFGAFFTRGYSGCRKIAIGIIRAAVKLFTLFGYFLYKLSAAFGAGLFNLVLRHRLCVFAFGVAGAGKEFAETARFYNHFSAAFIAHNVCFNNGHLYLLPFKRGFSLIV